MFQFRRFPTYTYLIQYMLTGLLQPGCPIRKSPDITLAYSSPRLIAVNHVLLRLPVPRHSPCALCSLTILLYAILLRLLSFHSFENVFYYPFLNKTYDLSKTDVISFPFLSFVLHLLCSVFKVRFRSKPDFNIHSVNIEINLRQVISNR